MYIKNISEWADFHPAGIHFHLGIGNKSWATKHGEWKNQKVMPVCLATNKETFILWQNSHSSVDGQQLSHVKTKLPLAKLRWDQNYKYNTDHQTSYGFRIGGPGPRQHRAMVNTKKFITSALPSFILLFLKLPWLLLFPLAVSSTLIISGYVSLFSCCCIKITSLKQVKGERIILTDNFKSQELAATGHITSTSSWREQWI